MLGSQITNKINQSLNIGSQVASDSHSNLLNSRVEFVVSDNEHAMTINTLQSKYHQLGSHNQQNHLNGQFKFSPTKAIMLGVQQHQQGKEESGMPLPRVVLYSPGRVQLEWKQSSRIGAGLVNLGNTCFMNTVIQCLTYCTPLANYLLHEEEHSLKCKLTGFCMLCEMQKHMKRALERHGQAIKPLYIYQKLKSIAKHFQFGRQEDAHEFLRYVIDNLWKSCLSTHDGGFRLDPASKETTVVNQIFGGYNRSQVVCLRCYSKSNTFDHFMDLILDIKQNVSSLQSALEKFVQAEMLEDDNAYKCPKCSIKVRAEKKFTVHKPPNVATFQFKRFDYNRMFGGKITKTISYPEKLDLRPFMSETEGPPVFYKLNSVLVHVGNTCNSGHYFCYVRNSNGCWYLMDDTRVHQVGLDQVLQQQAYVLFYVRVPSRSQECIKKPMHKILPANSNGKVAAQTNGKAAAAVKMSPTILHNGNSAPQPRSSPVLGPQFREKISFGIRRPSISTANGPQSQKSPAAASGGSTKTLVPYGACSSESSSSEDASPLRSVLTNGVAETPKGVFEHPVKLERSPLPKLGIGTPVHASRCKSAAPWHVVDVNLQSPSVASESSNNSINSTTDWSVVDRESKDKPLVGRFPMTPKDKTQEGVSQHPGRYASENGNDRFERTNITNGVSAPQKRAASDVNSCTETENRHCKQAWARPFKGNAKRPRDNEDGWRKEKQSRWRNDVFYANHRKDRKRRSSGTSNSSYEGEWIEKTKETVEMEKHRFNGFPGRFGMAWEGNTQNKRGAYKVTGGRWDGSRQSDVVDELRTSGYGVCTWNGNRSWMDQEPIRNRQNFQDDYDDEYDRGRMRRERKRYGNSYVPTSNGNPFQRFQNAKSNGHSYRGFNSFQQKRGRWSHQHRPQGRYYGNNRGYGGFLGHHHNRYNHR